MNKHVKADLMLLLATVFWGMTFVTVKDAMNYSGTFSFLFMRFFLGALVVFPFAFKSFKYFNRRTLVDGTILGILVFAGFALQTAGLRETSSTRSAFITGLSVVLVPVISFIMYRTKIDIFKIIGIVLSAGGLFLMFSPENGPLNRGDVLTVLCAFTFALIIVLIQRFSKRGNVLLLVFMQITIVAFISLVLMFATKDMQIKFSGNLALDLVFTSVFATAGALVLQYKYQQQTSEARAAIIYTLEPLFASIFAFIIFRERLASAGLLGGAMIFLGMLLSEFGE
ncbi:TPA: multidrug DMT transporter permease [candidate division WOR-3 bacterium]|uniref:Multidrug DMT transporter permease n=1 Tax=candidate division WOR-3 bacterium TaxID=2052148 RepID=A0A350H945_UNCW3|nr:multidrug DMT transporter permease [candidate division WOR-3 bacterium]